MQSWSHVRPAMQRNAIKTIDQKYTVVKVVTNIMRVVGGCEEYINKDP